jgi:hypothetical protein
MSRLLLTIHTVCAYVITGFIFMIESPVKILLLLFFLILGILVSLFYPLAKRIVVPRWMDTIYDYAADFDFWFAKKVWNWWH